jgi:hypothetical protein
MNLAGYRELNGEDGNHKIFVRKSEVNRYFGDTGADVWTTIRRFLEKENESV